MGSVQLSVSSGYTKSSTHLSVSSGNFNTPQRQLKALHTPQVSNAAATMNSMLVLGLVIAAVQAQINTGTKTANDPNKKFITLPGLDSGTSNLLIGGALGAGATLLGQELLGNNNNPCPPGFGRRKRQAGDEPNEKIFGLFDGILGGGNQNNPCYSGNFGQPQGYQQGYNQGYNNGFQNGASSSQGGFNQGGFHQGGSNTGGFNTVVRICQCSSYSKTDNYGREEAKCARADHTGRRWCYSSSSSNCIDAQRSSKYPNTPWSYEACNNYNG